MSLVLAKGKWISLFEMPFPTPSLHAIDWVCADREWPELGRCGQRQEVWCGEGGVWRGGVSTELERPLPVTPSVCRVTSACYLSLPSTFWTIEPRFFCSYKLRMCLLALFPFLPPKPTCFLLDSRPQYTLIFETDILYPAISASFTPSRTVLQR